MDYGNLIILLMLVIALLGRNNSVAIACIFVLLLKLLNANFLMDRFKQYGVEWGIIILMIGLLIPIVRNEVGIENFLTLVKSPLGVVVLVSGIIAAILATNGLNLMKNEPEVISGLVLGTVIGVSFLNGTPVGVLIASGIAAVLIKVLRLFINV